MKRAVATLALACAGLSALAQAPFTIYRPLENSRVRETVRVLIPKNSVPDGGYIGIFIDGKFVEATVPPLDPTKKFYEYDLATKELGIRDGKLSLEAVLFVDFQDRPRIVNRTSVDVTVANHAVANLPPKGLLMRYKWVNGTESIYDQYEKIIQAVGDSKENDLGGKPIERSEDLQHQRIMYAVDNVYPNGDGLIRIQPMPDKGKDYSFVQLEGSQAKEYVYADEMHALYMRVSNTGLQVWGATPFATEFDGNTAVAFTRGVVAPFPLPTLPARAQSVGSDWPSRFQDGDWKQGQQFETDTLVHNSPARGKFEDIEWEMGHPCAKLTNSIALAQHNEEQRKLERLGRSFTGNKLSEVQTIWFALDLKKVIRVEDRTSFEQQVAGQAGFGGGPMVKSGGIQPAAKTGSDAGSDTGGSDELLPTPGDLQTGATVKPGGGKELKGPGVGGTGGRPGGRAQAPATTTFVRITILDTLVLEL